MSSFIEKSLEQSSSAGKPQSVSATLHYVPRYAGLKPLETNGLYVFPHEVRLNTWFLVFSAPLRLCAMQLF
jgi:hypothetical protein